MSSCCRAFVISLPQCGNTSLLWFLQLALEVERVSESSPNKLTVNSSFVKKATLDNMHMSQNHPRMNEHTCRIVLIRRAHWKGMQNVWCLLENAQFICSRVLPKRVRTWNSQIGTFDDFMFASAQCRAWPVARCSRAPVGATEAGSCEEFVDTVRNPGWSCSQKTPETTPDTILRSRSKTFRSRDYADSLIRVDFTNLASTSWGIIGA